MKKIFLPLALCAALGFCQSVSAQATILDASPALASTSQPETLAASIVPLSGDELNEVKAGLLDFMGVSRQSWLVTIAATAGVVLGRSLGEQFVQPQPTTSAVARESSVILCDTAPFLALAALVKGQVAYSKQEGVILGKIDYAAASGFGLITAAVAVGCKNGVGMVENAYLQATNNAAYAINQSKKRGLLAKTGRARENLEDYYNSQDSLQMDDSKTIDYLISAEKAWVEYYYDVQEQMDIQCPVTMWYGRAECRAQYLKYMDKARVNAKAHKRSIATKASNMGNRAKTRMMSLKLFFPASKSHDVAFTIPFED